MYCNFHKLNLKKTGFEGCEVLECDFFETNLEGANFNKADLKGSVFENTNLTKASFVNAVNYEINPNLNEVKSAKFSMPEVLSLLKPFKIVVE